MAAGRGLVALAPPHQGELLALVADGLHPADPAAALAFLESFADRAPAAAAYLLRRGELREQRGRAAEAEADFRACLALAGESPDPRLATVRPLLGLARLAIARGDLAGAEQLAGAALQDAPRDPEALLAALFLAHARGGSSATEAFSRAHAARNGETPELAAAIEELRRVS